MAGKIIFDPEQTWVAVEKRLAGETDPRRRQLLTQVRDHMRSEVQGDFEALMNTLVDEPQYHLWGVGEETGPKGRAEVEAFYRQMMESGGNRFHFEVTRIVVDDEAVVTEGQMRMCMPGSVLEISNIAEVDGAPVESQATYVAETQILTVWPAAADGRLIGEDIYFGSAPLARLSRL